MKAVHSLSNDEVIEELKRLDAEYLQDGGSSRLAPLSILEAKWRLCEEREAYESGERIALLGAINICAVHDLPLPEWAARAYLEGYRLALSGKVGSWDDAFGKPFPGEKWTLRAHRRKTSWPVIHRIEELSNNGEGIGTDLFHKVGKEFGVCKTNVDTLWSSYRNSVKEIRRRADCPEKPPEDYLKLARETLSEFIKDTPY